MSIVASLISCLFLISGAFLSFGFRKTDRYIQFLMASTLGLGSSLIMVEILPDSAKGISEAFQGSQKLILLIGYIIIGIIIMKICDIFIPDHNLTKDNKKNHYLHIGLISSIPIILYNIIVGMKINITTKPFMLAFGLGFCNIIFGLLALFFLGIIILETINIFLTQRNNALKKKKEAIKEQLLSDMKAELMKEILEEQNKINEEIKEE